MGMLNEMVVLLDGVGWGCWMRRWCCWMGWDGDVG